MRVDVVRRTYRVDGIRFFISSSIGVITNVPVFILIRYTLTHWAFFHLSNYQHYQYHIVSEYLKYIFRLFIESKHFSESSCNFDK